jgi:hypothetical protein
MRTRPHDPFNAATLRNAVRARAGSDGGAARTRDRESANIARARAPPSSRLNLATCASPRLPRAPRPQMLGSAEGQTKSPLALTPRGMATSPSPQPV